MFFKLIEKLNIEIPLTNMNSKVSEFYTNYNKIKSDLPNILKQEHLAPDLGSKIVRALHEKYFSNLHIENTLHEIMSFRHL